MSDTLEPIAHEKIKSVADNVTLIAPSGANADIALNSRSNSDVVTTPTFERASEGKFHLIICCAAYHSNTCTSTDYALTPCSSFSPSFPAGELVMPASTQDLSDGGSNSDNNKNNDHNYNSNYSCV